VSAESAAPAYALPAGLTSAACEAFRDVEEEYRDGLSRELRRRRRSRRDLTSEHAYLHSFLQIAVLVVFGLAGLAGVWLTWRDGHRGDTSGESAG
jgi:hypothetical protein